MDGMIEVIVGPMFSGKTTELFRRLRRHEYAGRKTLLIRYQRDTRYEKPTDRSTLARSHDMEEQPAIAAIDLNTVNIGDADVIGIDEGQFLGNLVEFCERVATVEGKHVIVAALDGDYLREPFKNVTRLMSKAEFVDKLSAICVVCGSEKAAFTKRLGSSDDREVIGGAESYAAVCRKCYHKSEIPEKALKHHSTILLKNKIK